MKWRMIPVLVCALVLGGCATSKPTVYDANAVRSVNAWVVDFRYEAGRTEDAVSQEKGAETRVVREGRPRRELKLRDDIVFALKDQYGIAASRQKQPGSGEILLLPVDFRYGGFKSVDVEIVLPNGEMGGRVQVKNGDRNATFQDDDEFSEFVARSIANTIRGNQ